MRWHAESKTKPYRVARHHCKLRELRRLSADYQVSCGTAYQTPATLIRHYRLRAHPNSRPRCKRHNSTSNTGWHARFRDRRNQQSNPGDSRLGGSPSDTLGISRRPSTDARNSCSYKRYSDLPLSAKWAGKFLVWADEQASYLSYHWSTKPSLPKYRLVAYETGRNDV